jgi:hypothetical protein
MQAPLNADGSFTFPRVPAGQYVVRVVSFPRLARVPGTVAGVQQFSGSEGMFSGMSPSVPLAPMSAEPTLWSVIPLTVSNHDVDNVTFSLKPAGRFTGRLALDTGDPIDPAATVGRGLVVWNAEGRSYPRFQIARIEEDGRFTTVGLPPGHYRLNLLGGVLSDRASNWWSRWSLASMSVGGRRLRDMTLEIGEEDVSNVVLTFTEHAAAQLGGFVRSTSGAPALDAVLYAFPTDRQTWAFPGSVFSAVRLARPTQLGRYQFEGMPPGDYYVVAVAGQSARRSDAAFLDLLVPRAVTVSLTAGTPRTLDVIAAR